ncbi:hypothetical protein KAJ27_22620 [bacterium]|nr:hypothetical protein [bacterium]
MVRSTGKILRIIQIIFLIILLSLRLSAIDGIRKDYRDPDRQHELRKVLQKLGFEWEERKLYDPDNKKTLENLGYKQITGKTDHMTSENEYDWKINKIFGEAFIDTRDKAYEPGLIPEEENEEESVKKIDKEMLEFERIRRSAELKDEYFYQFNWDLRLETELRYVNVDGPEEYSPYKADGFLNQGIIFSGKKYFKTGGLIEIDLDSYYSNDRNFNDKTYRLEYGSVYLEKGIFVLHGGHLRPFLFESTSSIDLRGISGGVKTDNFQFTAGYGYNNRGINEEFYGRDTFWGEVKGNFKKWFDIGLHYLDVRDRTDSIDDLNYVGPAEQNWIWAGFIESYLIKDRLRIRGEYAFSEWNPDKNSPVDLKVHDHLYNMFIDYNSRKTSWNFKYLLVGEDYTALNGNYTPHSENMSYQLRYKFNEQIESYFDIYSQDFNYSSANPEKVFEPRISVHLRPFTERFPLQLKISHGIRSRRDEINSLYRRYVKTSYILEYRPINNMFLDKWDFGVYVDNELDYKDRDNDFSRHTYDFLAEKNLFGSMNLSTNVNYYRQEYARTLDSDNVTSWYMKLSYYLNSITGLDGGVKFRFQDHRGEEDDYDMSGFFMKLYHKMTVRNRIEFELNYDKYDYWDTSESRKDANSTIKLITIF